MAEIGQDVLGQYFDRDLAGEAVASLARYTSPIPPAPIMARTSRSTEFYPGARDICLWFSVSDQNSRLRPSEGPAGVEGQQNRSSGLVFTSIAHLAWSWLIGTVAPPRPGQGPRESNLQVITSCDVSAARSPGISTEPVHDEAICKCENDKAIESTDITHTHYLNVDLDIYAKCDLQPLVTALGKSVVVLYCGRMKRTHCAHLELARDTKTADSTIRRFCN